MSENIKEILEWIVCIIIAVVLALLFRYYLGTPTIVKHSSMYPTLIENDRLWLNRWGRTTKVMPKKGEIITFEAPSKVLLTKNDLKEENPVAYYENEPTNIFGKFTKYVLELRKDSYIKRAIALPGDHVLIESGSVYVNGEKLEEPYLQKGIVTDVTGIGYTDFVVPENTIFAMGDNRNHSTDCRNFGCVPLEKIESVVAFRFWPFNKFGGVK